MVSTNFNFVRVNRSRPCPICGKDHWCAFFGDGDCVKCMRVPSDTRLPGGGYVHRHDGRSIKIDYVTPPKPYRTDCQKMADLFSSYLSEQGLSSLSAELGVSAESLRRLCVGRDKGNYTFPMRNENQRIIGIRYRAISDGKKTSLSGSRNGLFIPSGLSIETPLWVCEGASDAATALDLGVPAIGRPDRLSCVSMTIGFIENLRIGKIVIISDSDEPGIDGAKKLCREIKKAGREVRVYCPPDGIKDLRAWVVSGATKSEVTSRMKRII